MFCSGSGTDKHSRGRKTKDRPSICRQPLLILISTWPREVEEVLAKHEMHSGGCGDWNLRTLFPARAVKAFVVKKAGARLIEQELIDFCRDSDRRLQGDARSGVYRCLAARSIRQGAQA